MNRFIDLITRVTRICVGLSFAVLIGAVLLQVVGRVTGGAPVWTEELTRFALLFTVAFGVGLAVRTGDLVNVDVVCESLPGRAPWVLRLISAIVTAAMAFYLLPHAWRYVSIGKMQTSPALGLRMDVAHASVLLLLGLLAVFSTLRVIGMLTGAEDGRPFKPEDD